MYVRMHVCAYLRRYEPPRAWVDLLLVRAFESPLSAWLPRELDMLLWALATLKHKPEPGWMDALW